ncbi:tyrosine-type recombinase/integrase [Halorubrum hochstenium]|uniref:Integrase-like protein n=1 Tax=Halorubrum hochstenium ATCC 700873 TaxID=1227481 RepID=M0F886_9EURY|nr:integrase-like protein [Halorubrum hochstenium ATCC 700873]
MTPTPSSDSTKHTGRILLDYGLRSSELAHSRPSWLIREKHPKTREADWCVDVPKGARCTNGNPDAGQGNSTGADLHNTSEPCSQCSDRSYSDKDWVDDEFHEKTPWHPKSKKSYQYRVWRIPKESALETIKEWEGFLQPDQQWPVTSSTVLRDVKRIRDRANALSEDNDDLDGINRPIHAHALRHTFGCRLAAAGFEPTVRMRQLRHGSYEMALYYSAAWNLRHRDSVQDSEWKANEEF